MSLLDKRPNYQFTPARNCTPEQDDEVVETKDQDTDRDYEVNKTAQKKSRPYKPKSKAAVVTLLPSNMYSSLSPEDKQVWSKLSPEGCATIIMMILRNGPRCLIMLLVIQQLLQYAILCRLSPQIMLVFVAKEGTKGANKNTYSVGQAAVALLSTV